MPAEKVYGAQLPAMSDRDGTQEQPPIVPIVDVRWNRQGTVQVVSKAEDPLGGRATDEEGVSYLDGFYVDLEREAINKLIRNLRRARDQAFGRDE
jgi:hypothetical protein